MTTNHIVEKIRALLTLAEDGGASEHEAETAARMAQMLMSKHGIDAEVLRQNMAADGFTPKSPPINSERHRTLWRVRTVWLGCLARCCAEANSCYVYWGNYYDAASKKVRFVLIFCGAAADRVLAMTLFDLLYTQVEHATTHCTKGRGRTYKNNFRLGMVGRLGERLKEAQAQAEREARQACATGAALVVVDRAIEVRRSAILRARAWVEADIGQKPQKRPARSLHDHQAQMHGRAEGDRATLAHDRVGG